MAATWGAQTWGFQNWGTLGDQDVTLSSTNLQATTSVGSVTIDAQLNVGWGGDSWGENAWGELSGVYQDVTGIQLTASIGSLTTNADANVTPTGIELTGSMTDVYAFTNVIEEVTGIQATITTGNETTGIGAVVTGSELTSSSGSVTIDDRYLIGEGWGRDVWGGWAWGVNYSVAPSGIELTSTIGNEDAFTDVVVEVTGQELQSAITPVGTSANSDNEIAHSFLLTGSLGSPAITGHALVEPSGIAATVTQGDAIGGTIQEVPVSGIELTTNIGNEDTSGNADVSVTGIQATGSIGDIVPVSTYEATGSSATTSIGSVTVTGGAVVIPTGISLTASTGTPRITAWAEVDTGTSVTWSEVDLAA